MSKVGKVYFVGAGPGDPELITVKGRRLLAAADVVLYAGSLVNPELLKEAPPGTPCLDTSRMTLEEIVEVMKKEAASGKLVVRLHSGDPALYGALQEQVEALEAAGIPFEVVPGVSSFLAAAALLKRELTIPGVTQTVILTRQAGRTPVPAAESLAALGQHRATLCLFLSAHLLEEAAAQLLLSYPPGTPVALVERATWPGERVLTGNLADLPRLAAEAGVSRTSLVFVGDFLRARGRSFLYDPCFTHGFREAKGRKR